jgi:hypothetical protein
VHGRSRFDADYLRVFRILQLTRNSMAPSLNQLISET